MDLSIIIVNWNSKAYLQKCIASILAETQGIKFEIVVIDGASFDGCDRMILKHYPQVRFIQSQKNIGFARANNEAFKTSSGKNLLFLNPDTEVTGGAIQKLLRQLGELPDAGVVGGKLLNSDRTIQETSIRVFPNILNQIFDAKGLIQRFPRSRLYGLGPLFEKSEAPVAVEAVSGACLMIKKSVFEDIGMFSPEYFMYSEDIDLCYKVRLFGMKTYYVPTAVVLHHGGGSSSKGKVSAFSNLIMLESRWLFFLKTRTISYCNLYRLAMLIACTIRILMVLFASLSSNPHKRLYFRGEALKKWKNMFNWALDREKLLKKFEF